jgi:hypothetical protein
MPELTYQSVLRKTDAGLAAFKSRDRAISQQARALMILLDGHKPVREVVKFSADADASLRLLGELLAAGFVSIEAPAAVAHAAPVHFAAAPTEQAPDQANLLKASIQRASRLLSDALGPNAEPICMQVERCKTMPELSAKIADGARAVGALRSTKAAEDFYRAATAPI